MSKGVENLPPVALHRKATETYVCVVFDVFEVAQFDGDKAEAIRQRHVTEIQDGGHRFGGELRVVQLHVEKW